MKIKTDNGMAGRNTNEEELVEPLGYFDRSIFNKVLKRNQTRVQNVA